MLIVIIVILSILVILSAGAGVYFFLQTLEKKPVQSPKAVRHIDPATVYDFVNHSNSTDLLRKDFTILDIRLPHEYLRGHIRRALNFNFHDPDFAQRVGRLNKTNPYIVCATIDFRSVKAVEILQKLGFTDLYIMNGGMLEWNILDFPLDH